MRHLGQREIFCPFPLFEGVFTTSGSPSSRMTRSASIIALSANDAPALRIPIPPSCRVGPKKECTAGREISRCGVCGKRPARSMKSTDRGGIEALSRFPQPIDERPQRGASLRHLAWHGIEVAPVQIAPSPGFGALERSDDGVSGCSEVLQRMRVLRILAAADMATRQTYAQLIPLRSDREALLAAVRTRLHRSDLSEMFAG